MAKQWESVQRPVPAHRLTRLSPTNHLALDVAYTRHSTHKMLLSLAPQVVRVEIRLGIVSAA